MSASCRPAAPPPQAEPTQEAAPTLALTAPTSLARVELALAQPRPDLPRGPELAGLVTALLELGLADLGGVQPVTQTPSPGLGLALATDAERWTLAPTLAAEGEALVLDVSLCTASGACRTLSSRRGTRAEPTPSVSDVLAQIAGVMLRPLPHAAAGDQGTVTSLDPYAVLLAGRAAATWYGILPAADPRKDRRRDPVSRALVVDPDTAVGNWIAGRRAMAEQDYAEARLRFTQAAFARPSSALLRADEATALGALGKADAAWYAWQEIATIVPHDPRFVLAEAQAALAAGRPDAAETLLADLPPDLIDTLPVVTLRVAAAIAAGRQDAPATDALLARQAELDPQNPDPVRQRVQARVRAGRYAEALPLADALASRGAEAEAARIRLALMAALGQWAEAGAQAAAAGDPLLASRLRARAPGLSTAAIAEALAQDPAPRAQAARAAALMEAGQPEAALAAADVALQHDPTLPEALAARASALERLGRTQDSAAARDRLHWVRPGGPE